MELGRLRALQEFQGLELHRLRLEHVELRDEVNALRHCLYSCGVVTEAFYDAELERCRHCQQWAQSAAVGKVRDKVETLSPQAEETWQDAASSAPSLQDIRKRPHETDDPATSSPCQALPLQGDRLLSAIVKTDCGSPVDGNQPSDVDPQLMPSRCELYQVTSAEPSTIAEASETSLSESQARDSSFVFSPPDAFLPGRVETAPLFQQQSPRAAPALLPGLLPGQAADACSICSRAVRREERSEEEWFPGASNEAEPLRKASLKLQTTLTNDRAPLSQPSTGSTISSWRRAHDTSAASFAAQCSHSPPVAADHVEAVSENREAWQDLADVKCRVYRASFAAKLHDVTANTAFDL